MEMSPNSYLKRFGLIEDFVLLVFFFIEIHIISLKDQLRTAVS